MTRILLFILFCLPFGLSYGQAPCDSAFTRKVDKFDGEISIFSTISDNVSLSKFIKKGVASYYLSLYIYKDMVSAGEEGVIILLEGGKRINKPKEEVEVEVSRRGRDYKYSAFIRLTPTDIALLRAHKMTDFKLYIYDYELMLWERDNAWQRFNCLRTSK